MLLSIYLFYYEVVYNYVSSIENGTIKLDNSTYNNNSYYEMILNQQHLFKTSNYRNALCVFIR